MSAGKLLLIGTPIGNLKDASPRVIEALKSCTRLLCEDTRHTRKLLNHFSIDVAAESFHEHNEADKGDRILDAIEAGETVGLVSDAGMPVISDPGFLLVRAARERGITVEPIPGANAAILALAASGIVPMPFTFYGFSPHRSGERREFFRSVAAAGMTAVIYESPERLAASLQDAREEMGNVEVTVAREMTKLHETFLHGTIEEVLETLGDSVRGEVTLVFAPVPPRPAAVDAATLREEFARLRDEGMRRNDAMKVLAERHHLRKNDLYRMLLE